MKIVICTLLLAAMSSCGQAVPSSAYNFFSYDATPRAIPPPGAQFAVNFPLQTKGSQDVIPACSTFGHLVYQWYAYVDGMWEIVPDETPLVRAYTNYFQTASTVSFHRNATYNLSVTGTLQNNTNTGLVFTQSWFWGSSQCFETGPEIGFYRNLSHPGNATEQNTIGFYYGLNVNCYTVGMLSSCRDRMSGDSIPPQIVTQNITFPQHANSQGGSNWNYGVALVSPTRFAVSITDPYTGANAVPVTLLTIQSFFTASAATMYSSGTPGYIAITQLRGAPPNTMTETPANPLRIVLWGARF